MRCYSLNWSTRLSLAQEMTKDWRLPSQIDHPEASAKVIFQVKKESAQEIEQRVQENEQMLNERINN